MILPAKDSLLRLLLCLTLASTAALGGCAADSDSDSSTDTSSDDTSSDDTSSDDSSSDDSSSDDTSSDDTSSDTTSDACDGDSQIEGLVCAVDAFIATLDGSEQDDLIYDWSDSDARTVWSNLPTSSVARNGLRFGDLSSTQQSAAMTVASYALSDQGYEEFVGIMASDDYLQSLGGGSVYSSDNYYIAIFGTPAAANDWALQIGGHHLAYNFTYLSGVGYPIPNLIAAEPKASFSLNSSTYAPVADEGDGLVAIFDSLSSDELDTAYLSGQSFSDVLIGPDNGSGVLPDDYPTGSNRDGLLVSYMTEDQQALVTAAIENYVRDFPDEVVDDLMDAYTSDAAFADTYVAWAGSQSAGVDVDRSGTYMRIDGPRLWIELACQNGVVIRNQTHYHSVYRDKTMDYGDSL